MSRKIIYTTTSAALSAIQTCYTLNLAANNCQTQSSILIVTIFICACTVLISYVLKLQTLPYTVTFSFLNNIFSESSGNKGWPPQVATCHGISVK